jgi:hypothetical protein
MTNRFIIAFVALLAVAGCNPGSKEKPEAAALVGTYHLSLESKKFLVNRKAYKLIPNSQITLRQDGSVSVNGLPDCYVDGFGNGSGQFLVGQGRWEIEPTDSGYGVTLTIAEGGTMKAGIYHGSSILIKRKMPPFALEFGIGDPDQDEYIVYEKTNS